jgi:hypothetical protein
MAEIAAAMEDNGYSVEVIADRWALPSRECRRYCWLSKSGSA